MYEHDNIQDELEHMQERFQEVHKSQQLNLHCHRGGLLQEHGNLRAEIQAIEDQLQEEQNSCQSEIQYEQESFIEDWDDYWAELQDTREKLLEECDNLQVELHSGKHKREILTTCRLGWSNWRRSFRKYTFRSACKESIRR